MVTTSACDCPAGLEDGYAALKMAGAPARLKEAGVPCHLEVAQGAFHGFDRVAARASVSRAFFASQCAALSAALGLPES